MTYLPAQVKISWKKPLELDDITLIEVYRYRKTLTRCEDYITLGTKIHETDVVGDGEYIDEIKYPSQWSYAVFCKNEVSRSPCIKDIHIVYPDRDLDGIEDSVDQFPQDTDNDGIENACDAKFEKNSAKEDTDGDNIIDDCDPDDDNDGILDVDDPFPTDYNRRLKITIGDFVYEQDYPHGAIVGLIASPNLTDGEFFLQWSGEVEEPTKLNTSIEMYKDQDVIAVFGVENYNLTIDLLDENLNSSSQNLGTVSGEGERQYGNRVGISAEPAIGFLFKEWQGAEFGDKYNAATTFIMPREDTSISAVFEPDPCHNFQAILTWTHNTAFLGGGSTGSSTGNGEMTAVPEGGQAPYSYRWIGKTSSADTITDLIAGDYSVQITDSNGCMATAQGTIKDFSTDPCGTLAVEVVRIEHNTSFENPYNGGVLVSASGGQPPYTYMWSGGTGFDDGPYAGATGRNLGDIDGDGEDERDGDGLAAGNYVVVVTDSNGCVVKASATVEEQAVDPCRDFEGLYLLSSKNNTVNEQQLYGDLSWLNWWENESPYTSYYEANHHLKTLNYFPNHDWTDPTSPWGYINLIKWLLDIGYINEVGVVQSINNQQLLDILNLFWSINGLNGTISDYDPTPYNMRPWTERESIYSSKWNHFYYDYTGKRITPSIEFSVYFGNNLIERSDILSSSSSHSFTIPAAGTRHPVYVMSGNKTLPPGVSEDTVYYAESYGASSNFFKLYPSKNSNSPIVFERKVDRLDYTKNEDLGVHNVQTAIVYTNFKSNRSPIQHNQFLFHLAATYGVRKHGGYQAGIDFSRYLRDNGNLTFPGEDHISFGGFRPYKDIIDSLRDYKRSYYLEESMRWAILYPAMHENKFNGELEFGFNGGDTVQSGNLLDGNRWYVDNNGNFDVHLSSILLEWGSVHGNTLEVSRGKYNNLPPGEYYFQARDANGCNRKAPLGDDEYVRI